MTKPIPKIVLDVNDSVDEMKELLTLALRDVSMLNKINEFLKLGRSSFIVAKTDRVITDGIEKIFTLYKLADPLKVLLETTRTRNIQPEISQ